MHKLIDGAKAAAAAFPDTLRRSEVRVAIFPPGAIQSLDETLASDVGLWVLGEIEPPFPRGRSRRAESRTVRLLDGIALTATLARSPEAIDEAETAIERLAIALYPLAGEKAVKRVVGCDEARTGILTSRGKYLWPHLLVAGLIASDDREAMPVRGAILGTVEVFRLNARQAAKAVASARPADAKHEDERSPVVPLAPVVLVQIRNLRETFMRLVDAIAGHACPPSKTERIAEHLSPGPGEDAAQKSEEKDADFRPARYFRMLDGRVRDATRARRSESTRVRKIGEGRGVMYSAADARRLWPVEMVKVEKENAEEELPIRGKRKKRGAA